jgi:hypothetical protein
VVKTLRRGIGRTIEGACYAPSEGYYHSPLHSPLNYPFPDPSHSPFPGWGVGKGLARQRIDSLTTARPMAYSPGGRNFAAAGARCRLAREKLKGVEA